MARGNVEKIESWLTDAEYPARAHLSNAEVAERLGVGKTAVAKVRRKLGLARSAPFAAGTPVLHVGADGQVIGAEIAGRPDEPQETAGQPDDSPPDLDPDDPRDGLSKIVAADRELRAARDRLADAKAEARSAAQDVKAAEKKLLRYTGGAGEVYPLFDRPAETQADESEATIANVARRASGKTKAAKVKAPKSKGRSRRASTAAGRPTAEATA